MHVPGLIEKKREGVELTGDEIGELIRSYTAGETPDYQMSAWAMAVFFRGMSAGETAALTAAMRDSGRIFRWPEGSPPKVDKHSTGGIGDKVSLVLAPLLACEGLWVPMVSGRGLGITGGTLDKLESIPGFRVDLDEKACLRQLENVGVFMAGQTADLCPADKKLYALRDVTGTVPSRALIIASIMSKKLAESLDRLVLDVKFGSGAFMKTRADAELLAEGLCEAGCANGVETSFILSPMDEPLGRTVGNALEVREAVETLQGRGPDDLVRITLDLAVRVTCTPRADLARRLEDGSAHAKFIELVVAQGGDPRAFDDWATFHPAPIRRDVLAPTSGTIVQMDAETFGRACVELGGGRRHISEGIMAAVGFSEIRKCGEIVGEGERLFTVHASTEHSADAATAAIRKGIQIEQ
jgi:pyrimidine-nucleoside phosphorylase